MIGLLTLVTTLLAPATGSLRSRERYDNDTAFNDTAFNYTTANDTDTDTELLPIVRRLADLSLSLVMKELLEENRSAIGNGTFMDPWEIVQPIERVTASSEPPSGDVMKIVAFGSSTQSAETAVQNRVAFTANDAAWLFDHFRGEDIGPGEEAVTVFEGDMLLENESHLEFLRGMHEGVMPWVAAGRPWTNGVVQYCFASDITDSARYMFETAVAQYTKALPCLTFVNVGWQSGSSASSAAGQGCQRSPAIFVMSNPSYGCYSYVGMIPSFPAQQLQLNDPGCLIIGTVVHEIGHALGMAHEQSRPDRDQYVRVNFDNVRDGTDINFAVHTGGYVGNAYDYLSVMHYDAFAFAKDRSMPTIVRLDGKSTPMGQRVGLSESDVYQITRMYQEVNMDCQANALSGFGCMDKPDSLGFITCPSKGSFCGWAAFSRCCACGGGTIVQCYAEDPGCSMKTSVGYVQRHWPILLSGAVSVSLTLCLMMNMCIDGKGR